MSIDYISIIGIVGGIITSAAGIPQIIKMIKSGQTNDLSWTMINMWNIGLIISLIYGIEIRKIPVILNITLSIIFTNIIASLKFYNEIYRADYNQVNNIEEL